MKNEIRSKITYLFWLSYSVFLPSAWKNVFMTNVGMTNVGMVMPAFEFISPSVCPCSLLSSFAFCPSVALHASPTAITFVCLSYTYLLGSFNFVLLPPAPPPPARPLSLQFCSNIN